MKYRVTHLKTGKVSILEAEKVRQIQENGFGGLFTFYPVEGEEPKAGDWLPELTPGTTVWSEDESPKKPTKAKKTPK